MMPNSSESKFMQFYPGLDEARKGLKRAYVFFLFCGSLFIFFIVSNAGIEGLKNNDVLQINESLQAMLAGIGPMILYLIYGWSQHPSHKDWRGFSDSFYYLGFTFTLISLFFAIASEKLFISANTTDFNASLTFFGTALSTTIFGIIVRTINTQFLYEEEEELSLLPDIEEKKMKAEVDKFVSSLAALNTEITLMSTALQEDLTPNIESLSIAVTESKEPFSDLRSQLTYESNTLAQSVKDLRLSFDSMEEELTDNLKEIVKPFNSAIDEISIDIKKSSEPIALAVNKIESDLENVSDPIALAVNKIERDLNNVSQPIKDSIDNISDQLNSQDISVDVSSLKDIFKSIKSLKNKLPILTDEMEGAINNIASISKKTTERYIKTLEDIEKKEKNIRPRNSIFSLFFGKNDNK
jgi:hypothetical protein